MRLPTPFALPATPTLGRDLVALGVSADRLARAVRSGSVLRLRQGVYLAATAWPDDEASRHLLRAAAEHLANPGGVVSHRSAALHWGLPLGQEDWDAEPVWLTVEAGRSDRGARLRLVVRPLPSHHVAMAPAGYAVTTVARTAVDLAGALPLPEALVVLDAAVRLECHRVLAQPRRRDFANPALAAAGRQPILEAAARLRTPEGLRAAIERADPVRESPIESLSFGHMVLAGLPLPVCQAAVHTSIGTFFPDFFWPEWGLIGESDGRRKYDDASAIVREKEREQALRDRGFAIVRWLGKEIHLRPDLVMSRIERALAANSAL